MVAACLENAYSYPHPNFRACHKSLNRQNFVSEIPHFVWEKQKTKCCCPNPPTLWRKNNKILLPKSSYSVEKKQQNFVAQILLLRGEKTTTFCCQNPPTPWRKNNKILLPKSSFSVEKKQQNLLLKSSPTSVWKNQSPNWNSGLRFTPLRQQQLKYNDMKLWIR